MKIKKILLNDKYREGIADILGAFALFGCGAVWWILLYALGAR